MVGGPSFHESAEVPQKSEEIKESPEKQSEINEVAESARTLEAATHNPEAKIESEGDYKQSESLQEVFTAAVDALPETRESDAGEDRPTDHEADQDESSRPPSSDGINTKTEAASDEIDSSSLPKKSDFETEADWKKAVKEIEYQGKQASEAEESKSADDSSRPPSSDEENFRPEAATKNVGEAADGATAAAVENQTIPDEIILDSLGGESQAEDGFVMRDPDGSDGSPEIDLGGLETTDDIREPTEISDAYGPDSMKGANQGEGVGYQGGEPADGLEMPGGLDGDLPGGIDGMPGGLDGDLPGGMGGDMLGGMNGVPFGNEDPSWSPGGESDNTDFITGDDLAGMAGSHGSLVGDDTDDAPGSSSGSSSGSSGSDSSSGSSGSGSSSGSSGSSGSGSSSGSSGSDSSSGTAGQRVYRRNTISRAAGYVWKAVSSGPGPDNPVGAGAGGTRGIPDPEGGSGGSTPLSTEELNEIAKKELEKIGLDAEETGPPPDLSGELEAGLNSLINWGDDHDEDDEEFVGSQPDVDITPVDPPETAGGGEGIEDTDGTSEGFEDIDP